MRFTGKEQDAETGLHYFGARYDMSALARWASADPLSEKHPEWTPYNYVLNNPPALMDPDGKQVEANAEGSQWQIHVNGQPRQSMVSQLFEGALDAAIQMEQTVNGWIEAIPVLGNAERAAGGVDANGTRLTDSERAVALVGAVVEASPLPAPRGSRLAQNLLRSGEGRGAEEAAHHIVARGAQAAAPARAALARVGVDIDEAANGVVLPAVRDYVGRAANHLTLHTRAMYTAVNKLVVEVRTREEAVGVLNMIKDLLKNGWSPR